MRKIKLLFCLMGLTAAFMFASFAAGGEDGDYSPLVLKRAGTPPQLDGVPDEECWRQADWRAFQQISGGTPKVGGKVALVYDGENLYAAFRLEEPTPDKMRSPKIGRAHV